MHHLSSDEQLTILKVENNSTADNNNNSTAAAALGASNSESNSVATGSKEGERALFFADKEIK